MSNLYLHEWRQSKQHALMIKWILLFTLYWLILCLPTLCLFTYFYLLIFFLFFSPTCCLQLCLFFCLSLGVWRWIFRLVRQQTYLCSISNCCHFPLSRAILPDICHLFCADLRLLCFISMGVNKSSCNVFLRSELILWEIKNSRHLLLIIHADNKH